MRKWTPRVKVDTAYNVSVCVCVCVCVCDNSSFGKDFGTGHFVKDWNLK